MNLLFSTNMFNKRTSKEDLKYIINDLLKYPN